MKSYGLFSFVIVLLFIQANFIILGMNTAQLKEYGEARGYLLQMENANFVRAVIEENFDYLIYRTMEMEIERRNSSPVLIKETLFNNIQKFFSEIGRKHNQAPRIEVSLSQFNYGIPKKMEMLKGLDSLGMSELKNNFNVLVVNVEEKIFLVEFNYTGGFLKNKILYAIISYPGYEQLFLVPVDYSSKLLKAMI